MSSTDTQSNMICVGFSSEYFIKKQWMWSLPHGAVVKCCICCMQRVLLSAIREALSMWAHVCVYVWGSLSAVIDTQAMCAAARGWQLHTNEKVFERAGSSFQRASVTPGHMRWSKSHVDFVDFFFHFLKLIKCNTWAWLTVQFRIYFVYFYKVLPDYSQQHSAFDQSWCWNKLPVMFTADWC